MDLIFSSACEWDHCGFHDHLKLLITQRNSAKLFVIDWAGAIADIANVCNEFRYTTLLLYHGRFYPTPHSFTTTSHSFSVVCVIFIADLYVICMKVW